MFSDGRNWNGNGTPRTGSGKGSDDEDDEDDDDEDDEDDDGDDDVEGLVSLDDVNKCNKIANPINTSNDRSNQSSGGLKNGMNKLGNGKSKHHSSFGKIFCTFKFHCLIRKNDSIKLSLWKVFLIFVMGSRWSFVG